MIEVSANAIHSSVGYSVGFKHDRWLDIVLM